LARSNRVIQTVPGAKFVMEQLRRRPKRPFDIAAQGAGKRSVIELTALRFPKQSVARKKP
jgi:hypothetical protein